MMFSMKKNFTSAATTALSLLLTITTIAIVSVSFSDAVEYNFSYSLDAENGPANWGRLTDIPNNECGGMKQSPIAIERGECTSYEDYTFTDGSCVTSLMDFAIKNNEVLATYPLPSDNKCTPNYMTIPGIPGEYEAIQFHIHLSSEHKVDDDLHAAELHIVHKSTVDDTLAVLGMFLDPKSAENNVEFDKVLRGNTVLRGWEKYANDSATICAAKNSTTNETTTAEDDTTTTTNSTAAPGEDSNATTAAPNTTIDEAARDRRHYDRRRLEAFNPYSLLAPGSGFYHYYGSLTTPPCSEIVWWSLSDTPVKISVFQYNHLTSLVLEYVSRETCQLATIATHAGTSSRPQQPVNGRLVKHICPLSDKPSTSTGADANSTDADVNAGSPSSSTSSAATTTKATTTLAESAAASIATYFMLGAAAALF